MPLHLDPDIDGSIELAEFFDLYRQLSVDPADQTSFLQAAPLLKQLANNRTFLVDFVLAEMVAELGSQDAQNSYSAQVVMLGRMDKSAFLRANIWPSVHDELYRKSGPEAFFYGVPHDHNFNFLTVGYHGPGYESDYYTYAPGEIRGYAGEPVQLRFVERRRLGPGQMMLYRSGVDVHNQWPPEALSVTLNIMDTTAGVARRNQYIFDTECKHIRTVVNRRCSPAVFALAAALDGDRVIPLLQQIAERHPDGFVGFHALRAAATIASNSDLPHLMEIGLKSPRGDLAGWTRRYLDGLQVA